jgi:hypothetical protein
MASDGGWFVTSLTMGHLMYKKFYSKIRVFLVTKKFHTRDVTDMMEGTGLVLNYY